MNTELTIHRCTVRFVRRGGWSWGRDPRSFLRLAMERLPALIGEQLSAALPPSAQGEIVAPLRVRLPVRMDELLAFASGPDAASHAPPDDLAQRIGAALRELVSTQTGIAPAAEQLPASGAVAPLPAPIAAAGGGSVLAVLLDWHRRGVLPAQLLLFSVPSLRSWHACLRRAERTAASAAHASLAALLDAWANEPLPLPAGERAALIRRIGAMVSVAGSSGLAPGDDQIVRALDAQRAFDLQFKVDARGERAGISASGAAPATPSASFAYPSDCDVKVASVLPFLLLGPLSRSGYLRALDAVFEAAQLRDELPCIACALARKVLAPPLRGWFRDTDAVCAATAFAGQLAPIAEPRLAALGVQLGELMSPLDAVLADSLVAGHTRGAGLLLQATRPGWLLCDAEGLFPIAWSERIERLFSRIAQLEGELLLVPEEAIEAGLLERLDDAGFRFVTDARPGRGQAWRALHKGALRSWTNDHTGAAAPLAGAATRIEAAGADGNALWRALMVERRALARDDLPQVECSLALAAALALGTLSWTLWRERESVTPLLALERFGDLDGQVSFRADRVELRLPLGRRFMDLQRGGLLQDVADVPWFGGRPLRFIQG